MKYFFSLKILSLFALISLGFLFIPPVYHLKWGSVKLITWDKTRGKIIQEMNHEHSSWQNIEQVSPLLLSAIIGSEDTFFYTHAGIDINSIRKSFKENYRAGYIKRGASTITQQVVKLSFLNQRRSYLRKAREIVGALLLEIFLNKKEILSWYLNLAYFGNGFHGIKSASRGYFDKSPENLNLNESISLALLLPSPNSFGLQIIQKKFSRKAELRFYAILKEMRNKKEINSQQWSKALKTGNFGNPLKIKKAP